MLLVALMWGFNFVAVKILYRELSAVPAAIVRSVLMTVLLAGACVATKVSLRIPKEIALRVHLQGLLSMGVYMYLFMKGMETTGAAEGAICLGTGPLFTLLLAILFKQEKFSWLVLGGTIVAFVGVAIVILTSPDAQPGGNGLMGPALLVLAAAVWASGTVVSRPLLAHINPLAMATFAMPAGTLFLLLTGWNDAIKVSWSGLSLTAWGMLLYFSLFAGFLGFWFFYKGVEQVGAAGAMLYQYFVAPLAAIFGFLVLHRGLSAVQFLGMAVLLTGVWLASSARQRLVGSTSG